MVVSIPGLPLYGVKADGTVWSKRCRGHRLCEAKEWKPLKPSKHPRTGYWTIQLQAPRGEKSFLVHQLVALAFLGPRPLGDIEINHKDGDKDNNSKDNLEYISYFANLQHAWDNNLIVIGKPKLSQAQVDETRVRMSQGSSNTQLARELGVYATTIRDIRVGKTWNNTESRVSLSAA